MRKLFSKEQILTIPNLLSFIRLLLIPIIVWLYCVKQDHGAATAVIVISGLTDVADGIIARKCNMVSDFGKILDPIADKLTQAALLICLVFRYPLMIMLIISFACKEFSTLFMGYRALKRNLVNSAKWYGKLNTVTLYVSMIVLILFPGVPEFAANFLIILCTGTSILAAVLYARFYKRMPDGKPAQKEENTHA